MSTAILNASPGDFSGNLAAFLAQVPAAADYDLSEYDPLPCKLHRPHRSVVKQQAIEQSWRGEA